MAPKLSIETKWQTPHQGPDEIRHTAALIRIQVGDEVATRIDDSWSQSVQDSILVAAYPLALWFASSWWRLRCETRPLGTVSTDWRMSHEMPAAGFGYIWPPLTFESDLETIRITGRASTPSAAEPIRYISAFERHVTIDDFDLAVPPFIETVIARLNAMGLQESPLADLWAEVRKERTDPQMRRRRSLEAQLGFDPEDAPAALLQQFVDLQARAGETAINELTPICAGSRPAHTLSEIARLAGTPGTPARVEIEPPHDTHPLSLQYAPYQQGRNLAHLVRHQANLNGQPVPDTQIAALLGLPEQSLQESAPPPAPPVGLAVRGQSGTNRYSLHFRKRNHQSRRFEAARFIAGHLLSNPHENWLPVTDAPTARQKQQRAFAAEFLCPIAALDEKLGDDYSEEAIDSAAEHFEVSEWVVRSQLVNNGRLTAEEALLAESPKR